MAWPSLRITALAAAMPLAVLATLSAAGSVPPMDALVAAGTVLAAALLLGAAWQRDLTLLADLLRRAATGGTLPHPSQLGHVPLLVPDDLLRDINLLSQTIGDRTDELERLRRAEESILERLPDPVIVLGPDRAVRRANAAARAAFGSDMAAVLRHPDLRGAIDRALAERATPRAQTADVSVPVPVPREVQATVVALNAPLAGGHGALVVLSDRTRERAVERMRADFVANASHELRTPLASLMGFIDTLRGPAADDIPAQKRFLDIMADQAARMHRLIDDLLSLSRIELVEHQPPDETINLVDLTERMLAGFEIRIKQRRVSLDWSPPEALPPVCGDEDQLEQVFQNLLDNALKYGREAGTVRVAISEAEGAPWPARAGVVLSVADDGPGIPRHHLARLTERFYRVDTGRSRAIGGTGLGLAIVKHVINRHRGQLMIESEEGKGAVFSVWLPLVS